MEDHPHRSRGRQHRQLPARRGRRGHPVRPRRRRRGGRPDGRHRDHQRDERARRPGHRQPPHAQDRRRRGLHPAQRQCVHQWFRRHGFHVIRFRIVRFVVIVRLVLLFGSGGGGMDVLQFRLGLHGRGGGLRRRRHPRHAGTGPGHRPEDDRLVQGLGRRRL